MAGTSVAVTRAWSNFTTHDSSNQDALRAFFTQHNLVITDAALGDFVQVSFSLDLQDMVLTGYVSAADTVEYRLQNESTGTVDLASGTIRVRVASHDVVDAAGDLDASTLTTPEAGD
jgi:hypothetical protein